MQDNSAFLQRRVFNDGDAKPVWGGDVLSGKLIDLLGRNDPDVRDSRHDRWMLWLDRKIRSEGIDGIFGDCNRFTSFWYHDRQTRFSSLETPENSYSLLRKSMSAGPVPKCAMTIIKNIEWERPIIINNRPIAFIDMTVTYDADRLILLDGTSWDRMYRSTDGEFSVMGPPSPSLWKTETLELKINFEVKPKQPTIGELLRQVKSYRIYLPGEWICVAMKATDDMKDVLKRERIPLIEPDDDFTLSDQLQTAQAASTSRYGNYA